MLKNAFTAVLILCGVLVLVMSCHSDDSDDADEHDDDTSDDEDDDTSDDDTGALCSKADVQGETWVDLNTGWMWQNESGGPWSEFTDAQQYCESLVLGSFDDWRLPSISELKTLICGCDLTETEGSCPITDDCADDTACENETCKGCDDGDGPGPGGCYGPSAITRPCDWFWSSTPVSGSTKFYWTVYFGSGGIYSSKLAGDTGEGDGKILRAICVRAG